MRKILMALLIALPLTVMAQQKIAVVNTQEIMMALPEVKAAETKLQEKGKQYDAEINSMQQDYKAKVEALMKEREKLPEAILLTRQKEIQGIEERIQTSYQLMNEQLQKEQQQLLAPIQTKVAGAIKKLADTEGYSYVMEAGVMLHVGKDAIDITEKVKSSLGVKAGSAAPAKPAAGK